MSISGAPAGLLEDFQAAGDKKNGHIGIVLVHGFTGSPAAMRPWAEFLNARGYSVRVPRLPGHGTKPSDLNEVQWQQWPEKVRSEILELQKDCSYIFVAGLSMGGGTTLNIAANYGDELSGIILVNPMIHVKGISPQLAFVISRVIKFGNSVGNDIKRKGVTEYSYDKLPYRGIYQLLTMLKLTRAALPGIKVPMQLFHSVDDHTLPVSNTEIIMKEIGSINKSRIELLNSYHVATIDHDAELIYENSLKFIESLSQ
ncbi:MAG: alpha/beta fold hydrolase [Candidatus Nanopelagicaceae bacterium]|nr:alpha/beta fold hydrolase [Candidatus Nanopelagicaceae bacterium]